MGSEVECMLIALEPRRLVMLEGNMRAGVAQW